MDVGSVAAITAAIIIVLAFILHKIAEKIVGAFVTSRLLRKNAAPHVTSDDLWPPQTVFAVYRFRRYWGMLKVSSPFLSAYQKQKNIYFLEVHYDRRSEERKTFLLVVNFIPTTS